jgi:hypothetical protein
VSLILYEVVFIVRTDITIKVILNNFFFKFQFFIYIINHVYTKIIVLCVNLEY